MKTLVCANHLGGPYPNGHGGCHTRWKNGFCSAAETANWLNSLGEDDDPYISSPLRCSVTNLDVRLGHINSQTSCRVVPIDREQALLVERQRRAQKELKRVNGALAALRRVRKLAEAAGETR